MIDRKLRNQFTGLEKQFVRTEPCGLVDQCRVPVLADTPLTSPAMQPVL